MMSKAMTAVILACGLLCALARADELPQPTGINTYTTHDGSPAPECSVVCWRTQVPYAGWNYHSTHNTNEQWWPEYHNRLRWGASSLGEPKIVIDTLWYHTFMGKKYIDGLWWYSEWSLGVYYGSANQYTYRELDLSLTEYPGDPSNIQIEE
ncbi:MAG: hypothetical protein JSU73_00975 [candidate division WOR-3 bacterium]|nr:MAG: hypothetical protein JSU73_00975 [candidate division WOR-3 bacterium]